MSLDENGYDSRYSGSFYREQKPYSEYEQLRNKMLDKIVEPNPVNNNDYSPKLDSENIADIVTPQDDNSTVEKDNSSTAENDHTEQQLTLENKITEIKVDMLSEKILEELNTVNQVSDIITEKNANNNANNIDRKGTVENDAYIINKVVVNEADNENIVEKLGDSLEVKTKKAVNAKLIQAISKGLSSNNTSEISIIESILSKGGLDVNQRFQVLSQLTADKKLNTTDRVALVAEINKSANLTRADKIAILSHLLNSGAIKTAKAQRYVRNKIALLYKAMNSKLVMTYNFEAEKAQRKQKILEKKDKENKTTKKDIINDTEEKSLEQLQKKLKENQAVLESVADILFDYAVTAEEKLQAINNAVSNVIKAEKTFTQIMVGSRDYFKFGAGVTCDCDSLQLTLPSGYKLDSRFSGGYLLAYSADVTDLTNKEYLYKSPLIVYVEKNRLFPGDDLLNFFNSNIEECNEEKLTYRQTVVGKCPAVIKYKKGSNEYRISVFNKKKKYTYMFKIQFNIPTINMQSVVNRILSSIVFKEG